MPAVPPGQDHYSIQSTSGGEYTRLRNQMKRLFTAHVQLIYENQYGEAIVSSSVADRMEF